ncbi:2,3-diaminopropionate biosynthesis protein SbnB [Amycolatopsis sp. YIM 10]|uniref:2,3-diaminopropionate biosynthesis protein SbnB n=1 Tax=Amycolatopsis sp. YIM 10 TaxID=2653857 RepID=UPI00128FDCD6|nr:2,3-diaminopropionate biosynthesis protein SbnB [Amycolatopsis sp. YIM 10]QFU91636.1 alanine dehydrogenase [Amycolatopsis sp. YIM 10]
MLVIGHADVEHLLGGGNERVLDLVRAAYRRHDAGESAVPHSVFLRFPGDDVNRVIGLPAYLGGERPVAGMKWIASFPGNPASGLERASAGILLNSMNTGHPVALIEGARISAKRTAASAAVAAQALVGEPPSGAALIGCGVINFEVFRFLTTVFPGLAELTVFDTDPARAARFAERCSENGLKVRIADTIGDAMAAHSLTSIATTATTPHLDLSRCRPGAVVLHVSLRDLTAEAILGARNVVDDADHVCRERTSLHLAEQQVGHRDFIDAPIGALLRGTATLTRDPAEVLVFSPFGLGALDMALAAHVHDEAVRQGRGARFDGFLPGPWESTEGTA